MHRSLAAAKLVVLVAVASCGQAPSATTPPTVTAPGPPAGGTDAGTESQFGRRDLPPAGVAEFLFFEGGSAGDDPIATGLASVSPRSIRLGETAELVVAGGPPDGSVSVHLYRFNGDPAGDAGFQFVADIGPIELDPNGGGRLALRPRRGDPPGHYGVIVLPIDEAASGPPGSAVIRGTADDYLVLATAAGLTCQDRGPGPIPGGTATACLGLLEGAETELYIFVSRDGTLVEVSATVAERPDVATALFIDLARVATGDAASARWVESFTPGAEPFHRDFGGVPVEVFEEFGGGRTIRIGSPPQGGPPPDGWVGFDVRP